MPSPNDRAIWPVCGRGFHERIGPGGLLSILVPSKSNILSENIIGS